MKNNTFQLLRIGKISGNLYTVGKTKPKRLVVYGMGAPLPPDNGTLSDAPFILDFDVDLFVPDYIGFGRSEGAFTPKNCIQTFGTLFEKFTKGTMATNGYLKKKLFLQYDEIFFIGRSFGGMYISLLPKLNPSIKNLCLIFPILDFVACGKIIGEETPLGFMKAMNEDGYKNLYRGINKPVWEKHFSNSDNLCPMENVEHLKNVTLFIGHGKKDTNINFSHSVRYFKKIATRFPNKTTGLMLKLYNGDHSLATSNKAVADYLTWMKIPKRNS